MHMLVLNLLEVKSFGKIYSVKSHLYYSSLDLRYFKVSFRLPWEKKQWKKYLLSKLDQLWIRHDIVTLNIGIALNSL